MKSTSPKVIMIDGSFNVNMMMYYYYANNTSCKNTRILLQHIITIQHNIILSFCNIIIYHIFIISQRES